METATAYLCPVCGAVLVRVTDPSPDAIDLSSVGSIGDFGPAIQRAMSRHYQEVDRLLAAAVDDHDCPHRMRWRRWKRKHAKELATVAR